MDDDPEGQEQRREAAALALPVAVPLRARGVSAQGPSLDLAADPRIVDLHLGHD
jgi:hypothetical protein